MAWAVGEAGCFFLNSLCSCLYCGWGPCLPMKIHFLSRFLLFVLPFLRRLSRYLIFGYQFERLGPTQYGAGEATLVFGYRLGMLLAGAGSLYMATWMTWNQVYQSMALISLVGVLFTFRIAEPDFKPNKEAKQREQNIQEYLKSHPKLSPRQAAVLSWCYGALVCPFTDFARSHKGWVLILLLMFFYRLGDNLIGNMSNIFYAEWGYTNQEIAQASKIFGMGATILGGFVGGLVVTRWGMMKGLFYCCLFHAFATLAYLWVYEQGHDMTALYTSIALENITGGMRVTALFAYQLTLCSSSYAATQLSLMSSLIEFGRATCSSLSGWLVTSVGWKSFFIIASLASFPPLFIVILLSRLSGESLIGRGRNSSFSLKNT